MVLSIPDYGYTPFGKERQNEISRQIDAFNSVNKRIAQQKGTTYVDITAISRKAFRDPALVAEDGLHPSGKMYGMWVTEILKKNGITVVHHLLARRRLSPTIVLTHGL